VIRSYPLIIHSFLGDKVVIVALATGSRILFLWIPNRDAESILKERYAKGELTKEQFEQMMLDLKNNT
jgi:uncharacterized membrane protein